MLPRTLALALAGVLLLASPTVAQVPGFGTSKQFKLDRLSETHWRATGQVEMQRGDLSFFADVVDYHTDTQALEASGNVVFVSRDDRVAAERAEFNTRTRTGTFYTASGSASLGDRGTKSMFGTQEPDAYFYGETIEKLGPAKYRIVRGGFTTCLQPTPRWEIVASSAVITLDEYAVLRNSVLRVKGVPLLYLPIIYYPINDEDRATGFLIPVYGTSKIRGQSLSNAFFWAISRSQDATVFHDWYSKTGQGAGGEYRYIASQGSDGQVRMYWLNEKGTTYESETGPTELPARRSYELRGYAQQTLPFNLRARVNVDYFSDITVQQLYHNNLYDASRRQRLYGANVAGAWGGNRVSFTYNRSELFYGATDSQVYGGAPRLTFDRSSLRVAGTPVYFNLGAEYNNILRSTNFGSVEYDQGLTRMEVRPAVTAPFTKWPFFTVNAAAIFYATWYSESLNERGIQVNEPVTRNYLELRADTVGPKLQRVWSTPDNGYAEKFKHVIEPTFSVQRTSLIENFDSIVKNESNDYVLGGTTRLSYGLTNRFLAKRRDGAGQAREFVNVTVFQSYYTDPRASLYDPSYGTSFAGRPPSSFSPIAFGARVSPTDRINGALRLEYDYQLKLLQSVRANGSYALSDTFQVQGGWSQRNYTTNIYQTDNYLDISTSARTPDGRVGGHYSFNYDFRRETLLQQTVRAYYNAQCCGVIAEYQQFGYPRFDPRYPVEADRRFTISFTLAGVGTFSPFLGAFGGSMSSGGRGF